jgi:hypothetical protein
MRYSDASIKNADAVEEDLKEFEAWKTCLSHLSPSPARPTLSRVSSSEVEVNAVAAF